jgi:anti-sigma B factor antagonist
MRLRIRISTPDSSQPQVFLAGEVDLETVPELKATLEGIAQGKPKQVVLDLSELSYLSSAGVSAIITASEELKARGAELVITGAYGPVKLVLEMLGLSHLVRQTASTSVRKA